MPRWLLTLGMMLAVASAASAAHDGLAPLAETVQPKLPDLDIVQKLNAQVPLDLELRDEVNYPVTLRQCINGKPTILVLAYYRCPQLCTQVLNGLVETMRKMPITAGQEYNVVTVSFDPKEHAPIAALKKMSYVSEYGRFTKAGGDAGWRFLTGDPSAKKAEVKIKELADSVGYPFEYDKKSKIYKHASAIMVLTPEGKVSKYFFGITYDHNDLRLALIEASNNKIGTLSDKILLFCMDFDHATGKYTASVRRIMQLSAGVTLVVMVVVLSLLFRWGPRPMSSGPEPTLTA